MQAGNRGEVGGGGWIRAGTQKVAVGPGSLIPGPVWRELLHQVGRFTSNRKRRGNGFSISAESRGPPIRDMCMFALVGGGVFPVRPSPSRWLE